MRCDYITEVSIGDFMKMGLIGYKRVRKPTARGVALHYDEVSLSDLIKDEADYLVENARKGFFGEADLRRTIAVFVSHIPDDEEAESRKDEMLPNEGEPSFRERLITEAIPLVKYYWQDFKTYCIWDCVEHIYSERNHWLIKADSECGRLPKDGIERIYLIHF